MSTLSTHTHNTDMLQRFTRFKDFQPYMDTMGQRLCQPFKHLYLKYLEWIACFVKA